MKQINLENWKFSNLTTEQKKKIKKYILITLAILYVVITLPFIILFLLMWPDIPEG